MKKRLLWALVCLISQYSFAQTGPVPNPQQLAWSDMEFYFFIHFGPNTFTDLEWGHGTEKEELFNPTALDCDQWCRIAKAAGAKGIILTAKHHDGFCLWPSKYSTHTIRESKWQDGKGDILKLLSEACRRNGLQFGVYLSPWDRNHPEYGTPEYNDVFVNMMKEIVSSYGPLFEFWWDGANGEGPNGKKQVYDWHRFEQTMRGIAPRTVIFSDIGPDVRWVGNEKGIAGDPNWNLLDTAGFTRGMGAPPNDTLNHGNMFGRNWIPAECDVSIRPGWFYHQAEDEKVKTPEQLFDLWLKSVGRGANLLLNVPPDRRGLINAQDSAALVSFRSLREKYFGHPLAQLNPEGKYKTAGKWQMTLAKPAAINCIGLQEDLVKGQQVISFEIRLFNHQKQVAVVRGNTIGHRRLLSFPAVEADAIECRILSSKGQPVMRSLAAYYLDPTLMEQPVQ